MSEDPASPFQRWRPPTLTAPFRGRRVPPVDRWEAVLRGERTVAFRLVSLASKVPWLARLVGVPVGMSTEPAGSLGLREQRLELVERTLVARLLRSSRATRAPVSFAFTPDGRPKPGPLTDREIDAALELVADMPFEELQERGWHVQPNHWCWPLNDVPFLRRHPELWRKSEMPRGVDWDVDGQVDLIRRLAGYAPELADVPLGPEHRPGEFVWDNGAFGGADGYAYYGLLRELKPRHVVEVGAGASSLVLGRALEANGGDADVTLIEPGPRWQVLGELPKGWRLVETIVQQADTKIFETLGEGDVLFYDGSHCAAAGGDVNWMFFEVLPRLAPGVWIHFHDIFWPLDYPAEWVLHEGLTWNEQYLLQTFLMHNDAYRVRLAMAMLTVEQGQVIRELFPERPFGASVWLQKTQAG